MTDGLGYEILVNIQNKTNKIFATFVFNNLERVWDEKSRPITRLHERVIAPLTEITEPSVVSTPSSESSYHIGLTVSDGSYLQLTVDHGALAGDGRYEAEREVCKSVGEHVKAEREVCKAMDEDAEDGREVCKAVGEHVKAEREVCKAMDEDAEAEREVCKAVGEHVKAEREVCKAVNGHSEVESVEREVCKAVNRYSEVDREVCKVAGSLDKFRVERCVTGTAPTILVVQVFDRE